MAPPPEQAPLAYTADTEPPPEQAPLASTADTEPEDRCLFSLTDRMSELGESFKLPEGWQDYNEEEFNLLITDALAAMGINKSQLPEGWTMVITWRTRKCMRTLPNVPEFLVGTMYNYPHLQEPEEQWEWEVSIHAHIHNLMSDDTFDVLENLPPMLSNPMFPETVPQDVPDDDDDERWTSEMSRRKSNLQSRSKISIECDEMGLPVVASLPELGLNKSKEMGLPDLGGLPELPANTGLPQLPSLPGLPDIPDLPN